MHSPPIDLLTNAPKPQKAAPTESEPDGRFSELLRAPSEAEATRPDTGTAPKSDHAAPAEGAPQAEVTTEPPVESGQQVTVEPAANNAAPESPQADKIGIAPLVAVPEAITWVVPQGGAMPGTVAAAPSASSTDAPLPQTPAPAAGGITPPAPATPSNGVAAPAPAQVPTLVGGAIGVPAAPQAAPQANTANPADGGVKTGPIAPGNAGANPTAPASSSPVVSTQPLMATAAPVAAAGKAVAGNDERGSAPRPSATVPTTMETASNTVLADRPTSVSTPAPERLATAQTLTPVTGEPPAPKDDPNLPATTVSKAISGPGQAAANTSVAKAVTAPAAATLANDKATAAPATAVPSTVAETADAAAPQAGQADPVAAANASPVGRMNVSAASSAILAHAPSTAQPAAEQVVLQVQRAVREGVDRLTMQLKPASLGRVDIQMEVGFDGRLQAVISAERPETLHLLQRDARMLTEALNDAGLQTDSGSLSFNLRGQAGDHGGGNGNEPTSAAAAARSNLADESTAATTEITLTLGDGRVDIKV